MRRSFYLVATVLFAGCTAVLGLDDLSFDLDTSAAGAGGSATGGSGHTGGGGGGVAGSGGHGGAGGGVAGTGGQGGDGGSQPVAPILQTDETATTFTMHADPLFRLVFTENDNWQLTGWYDLGSAPSDELGPQVPPQFTNLVFNPVYVDLGADTWVDTEGGSIFDVSLYESYAGRATLHTEVDLPATTLRVRTDYTVYASGRVGTFLELENTGPTAVSLAALEFGYLAVNGSYAWTPTEIGSVVSVFERTDVAGTPTIVAINHDGIGAPGSDTPHDHYWDAGPVTLQPSDILEHDVELQVWPSSAVSNVTERVNDARNPGLVAVTGANYTGYDFRYLTYDLDVAGSTVTFAPSNVYDRHYPAFYLQNWGSATWSVWLGTERLCSSADPLGARANAVYYNGFSLVITYLDVIPKSASLADRTFTVRSTP